MKLIVMVGVAATLVSFGPQEPAKPATPQVRQETFMAALKAEDFAKAYENLMKGSRIEEKADQVANLRDQTQRGVGLYGGAVGWENLGIVRQEKHQAFGMAILCCKQSPMHFYFVWYRPTEKDAWMLINVWFSDNTKDYWQLRGS